MKKVYCYIEWWDPVSDDTWRQTDEIRDHPNTIKSIGWLIKESSSSMVLGLNSDENEGSYSLVITIPKVLIRGDVQRLEFTPEQAELNLE